MSVMTRYAVRNLRRRLARTVATCFGLAMAVFAAILMLALTRGIFLRTSSTGEPQNVLAISRNGQTVMFSSISDEELTYLDSLPGIAKAPGGIALISPEVMHMTHVDFDGADGGSKRAPVSLRGVRQVAYQVHRGLVLSEGKLPEDEYDILVGDMVHVRLGLDKKELKIGSKLIFEGHDWNVCGRFKAEGSLLESEMWIKEETLKQVLRRKTDTFVVMRFENAAAAAKGAQLFSQSGVYEKYFKGWIEMDYYRQYNQTTDWLLWLSILMVAAIEAAGAMIGVNMMFSAALNRMPEFGTLRVLGFSRLDISLCLLVESMAIALIGGALGIGLGYLANNVPVRFSTGAFYLTVDYLVLASGIVLSLIIGIAGGIFPLTRILRLSIIDSLSQE